MSEKQKRNELCPCGSQKKYKKCCGLQKAMQKKPVMGFFRPGLEPAPSMQGLASRVFRVMGSEPSKPIKELQAFKKD